jgi:hypothetical protein
MELMRHSDMRLTAKTYTDAMSLPLFGELDKLTPSLASLPSLPASLNCEKMGVKVVKLDQTETRKGIVDSVVTDDRGTALTGPVQTGGKIKLAERGGFEPPVGLSPLTLSRRAR